MPPNNDPAVQMAAKRKARVGMVAARAIRSTSGGMGKNDDSTNAMRNNAQSAPGLVEKLSTHLYRDRIQVKKRFMKFKKRSKLYYTEISKKVNKHPKPKAVEEASVQYIFEATGRQQRIPW